MLLHSLLRLRWLLIWIYLLKPASINANSTDILNVFNVSDCCWTDVFSACALPAADEWPDDRALTADSGWTWFLAVHQHLYSLLNGPYVWSCVTDCCWTDMTSGGALATAAEQTLCLAVRYRLLMSGPDDRLPQVGPDVWLCATSCCWTDLISGCVFPSTAKPTVCLAVCYRLLLTDLTSSHALRVGILCYALMFTVLVFDITLYDKTGKN